MKRKKNNFFIYVLLIQFCFLYSSHEFHQVSNDAPHVEMNFNNHQDVRPAGHCYIRVETQKSKYPSMQIPASHVIAKYGSLQLKNYLATVITPMMRTVTMDNYYCALAGYASPHGLRDCLAQTSQFLRSDERVVIEQLNTRIESYCTRIDEVLFDKQGMFC